MQEWMVHFTHIIAQLLELIGVIMIALGAMQAAIHILWSLLRGKSNSQVRRESWLNFARWLLLGLEFALAADIVHTVVSPSWDTIGQLAAIAFIRTFLSFFLERDLESATKAGWKDPRNEDI